jgi:hypothetical protein
MSVARASHQPAGKLAAGTLMLDCSLTELFSNAGMINVNQGEVEQAPADKDCESRSEYPVNITRILLCLREIEIAVCRDLGQLAKSWKCAVSGSIDAH